MLSSRTLQPVNIHSQPITSSNLQSLTTTKFKNDVNFDCEYHRNREATQNNPNRNENSLIDIGQPEEQSLSHNVNKMQLAARQVMPRDLPHFNGRPEEWPLFISSFEAA